MIAFAIVVVVVGAWFVLSAQANWEWYKGLTDFAVVDGLLGDTAVRWAGGLFGVVLVVGGIVWLVQGIR